ncbi:MAG: membrane protein containing DUF116 [Candidatus Syntrophoarchaeum caldarius]|uniref:Membrane protein containing DUF116 n=1 Tax=Candidatus Syntropharchaeum caldarium TaxID=1838285 RepID=A0A1F2PBT1_9EURY|nr:MAG: membrane protein containing DUF116 [Candidatus Syntrophoarchaeum caldarius]
MLINILTEAEFELLGKFLIALVIAFVLLLLLIFVALVRFMKEKKTIHPNLLLTLIQIFYNPLTLVAEVFSIEPDVIDRVFLRLNNSVTYDDFAKTDLDKRVIILPQCMRDLNCPAKLSAFDGFHCKACGMCQIGAIKNLAEGLGMKLFIVPGGSFAKRILKRERPEAVIGVACFNELYEGLLNASLFDIQSQGVPLVRQGCVATALDYNALLDVVLAGVDDWRKIQIYEEAGCHYMQS